MPDEPRSLEELRASLRAKGITETEIDHLVGVRDVPTVLRLVTDEATSTLRPPEPAPQPDNVATPPGKALDLTTGSTTAGGPLAPLVAFLRARYDERERLAQAALRFHPAPWRLDPAVETTMDSGRWVADADDEGVLVANGDAPARFFAGHDPKSVLDDIAAKRRIIDLALDEDDGVIAADRNIECEWSCASNLHEQLLRLLALPFAGHPDYDESWRP